MQRVASLSRHLLLQSSAFLFLIAISVASAGGLVLLQNESAGRVAELNRVVQTIHEVRGDLYRQLKELFDYVFIGDPDALVEFEAFGAEIDRNLARLSAEAGDQTIGDAVAELNAAYAALRTRARAIMNQTQAGFPPDDLLQVFEASLEQGDMLQYERAVQATGAVIEAAQQDLERSAEQLRLLTLGGLAVPLVVGVVLLLVSRRSLRRRIAEPVNALLGAVESAKGGRLERRVPESGPAEFLALQEAFNRMAAQLQQSQTALLKNEKQAVTGALVPIIAHNIRNPLASIRATAQLMEEPMSLEEQRRSVAGILHTVDRLDNWISQFLTYLNPLSPNVGKTSMLVVADHAVRLLGFKLGQKKLGIRREGGDDKGDMIADRNLLEQAVCGLLSNAIDAAPPESEIALTVTETADEITLAIKDSGPGMPFPEGPSGVTPGPTTKVLGGGLGVPFARKVCEIHGGSLEFRPAPEGGTMVMIHLPKAQPGEAGGQGAPAPAPAVVE